jgi:cytochrome d ubiquinol oxidase subunit II
VQGVIPHDGPSNPLYKEVFIQAGAWFANYSAYPITMLVPGLSIISALFAIIFARKSVLAFLFSALSVGCLIATVGVSMFPFILPSSTNPKFSLLVWDSSSSHLTLFIMLVVTVIFLPIVVTYTAWVYKVLSGKVTEKTIIENKDSAY